MPLRVYAIFGDVIFRARPQFWKTHSQTTACIVGNSIFFASDVDSTSAKPIGWILVILGVQPCFWFRFYVWVNELPSLRAQMLEICSGDLNHHVARGNSELTSRPKSMNPLLIAYIYMYVLFFICLFFFSLFVDLFAVYFFLCYFFYLFLNLFFNLLT